MREALALILNITFFDLFFKFYKKQTVIFYK